LRCPDPSCSAMVLQGMVNELAKDEDKAKYARFLLRAYVEGSKKVICLNNLTDYPTTQFFGPTFFFLLTLLWHHVLSPGTQLWNLISCRLNGVQLLTVHVLWSFLVMKTMMSHAIASSAFAGMYDGSILLMILCFCSRVLGIEHLRPHLLFAVH
jgi:hypothetical protein